MKVCLVTLAKQLVNITRKTKEIIFFFIHISLNVVESQYERQGPWRVSMDLALWIAIIQKCAMKGSSIDTLLGAISITLSCLKSAQCFDTLLGPCL